MSVDVAEELRRVGLRATVPRMKVLSFFLDQKQRHFTAEDVCRQVADENLHISFGSIYRVLQQLVEAKILRSGTLHSTRIVYELDNTPDHDHAICVSCGQIEEFHDPLFDARQKEVGERLGFLVVGRQLVLHGYCVKCRAFAPGSTGNSGEQ
ncbi:Fur family ferric uptake transcriptional regulator [Caballeronia udeis]|uniref:Ferric uptake regulation protein n=1 Tax=Caballeronia udeis TaxID=1232866 RepID=A0ABW8MXF6_9BURK